MINQVFQSYYQKNHSQLDIEITNQGEKFLLEDVPLYGNVSGFFAKLFGLATELKVETYLGDKKTYIVNKKALIEKGNKKHVDISELAKQSVIQVDERLAIPDLIKADFLKKLDSLQEFMESDPEESNKKELTEEIKKLVRDYPKLRLLIPTEECANAIYGSVPTTEPFNFYNVVLVDILRIKKEYKFPKWTPDD